MLLCNWYTLRLRKGKREYILRSMQNVQGKVNTVTYTYFNLFLNLCHIQHAQRDLARNHSGPTSVKSRKCRRNLKKMSVLTPRNVREKSNTVIYYKTPTLTIKRREIKKWDINLYLYICMFLRLSFLII